MHVLTQVADSHSHQVIAMSEQQPTQPLRVLSSLISFFGLHAFYHTITSPLSPILFMKSSQYFGSSVRQPSEPVLLFPPLCSDVPVMMLLPSWFGFGPRDGTVPSFPNRGAGYCGWAGLGVGGDFFNLKGECPC